MASPLDTLGNLPIWQRFLAFVLGAAVIGGVWYFVFYSSAVEEHEAADKALAKAKKELDRVEKRKGNFEQEQAKAKKDEEEIKAQMEVLPMSSTAVDNLMQTFQQHARLVGLTVETWTNSGEEKLDFYAKLPIEIKATGSWPQVGEFLRRIAENRRPIVSVENLSLRMRSNEAAGDGHPALEIDFEASTYRFLSDAERSAATEQPTRRKKSRRKGKKKKK